MSDATIEQRLIRLELSARRWRRGCVGLAVAGVLAVGVGAMQVPKPGVVKATEFVLVDSTGDERGNFKLIDAAPRLSMKGKTGKSYIVALGVFQEDAVLMLTDRDSKNAVWAGIKRASSRGLSKEDSVLPYVELREDNTDVGHVSRDAPEKP